MIGPQLGLIALILGLIAVLIAIIANRLSGIHRAQQANTQALHELIRVEKSRGRMERGDTPRV